MSALQAIHPVPAHAAVPARPGPSRWEVARLGMLATGVLGLLAEALLAQRR
jgi:hypothetical protein